MDYWTFSNSLLDFVNSGKGLLIWGNDVSNSNLHGNSFLNNFYAGSDYKGDIINLAINGTIFGNKNMTPTP